MVVEDLLSALCGLAERVEMGDGVGQDHDMALAYYREAARLVTSRKEVDGSHSFVTYGMDHRVGEAGAGLGWRRYWGSGVDRDFPKALDYYREASRVDDDPRIEMGVLFKDDGTPLLELAEQGDEEAQRLLAYCVDDPMFYGRGELIAWYEKAVGQGYACVQYEQEEDWEEGPEEGCDGTH